ncbi:MAG: type II CAAX endopeptidase family protein [Bacillota bacterium]
MTKTTKLSIIFISSIFALLAARILFSFFNLSDNILNWLFSFIYQLFCLGVLPIVMYKLMISKDTKTLLKDARVSTKLHPRSWLVVVALGLMVFFFNSLISSIWYTFMQSVGYTYTSGAGTIYSSPEVLIFEIILTCMFPAIFEEFVDRGILLGALDNLKSDRLKIAIVTIFFGLVHQNIAQFIPTMLGGLIMAYLAVKGRSILPGVIIHFMNNFFVVMVSYNSQKGNALDELYNSFYSFYGANIITIAACSVLAIAITVWLLKKFTALNYSYRAKQEWVAPLPVQVKPAPTQRTFMWQKPNTPSAPSTTDSRDGEFFDVFGSTKSTASQEPIVQVPPKVEQSFDDIFNQNYTAAEVEYDIQPTADSYVTVVKKQIDAAPQVSQESVPEFPAPQSAKGLRAWFFDYGFLIIGAVMAFTTTISSFIWGLLR